MKEHDKIMIFPKMANFIKEIHQALTDKAEVIVSGRKLIDKRKLSLLELSMLNQAEEILKQIT